MDITYKVRGTDGKEYNPVTLEQLSEWLRENRIGGESEVMRSDMSHWARARDFSELQPALRVPSAVRAVNISPVSKGSTIDPVSAARLKSGASWLYWIAGLSLVNSIVA